MKKYIFILVLGILFLSSSGCGKSEIKGGLGPDGLLCDFENLKVWGISPERDFRLSLDSKFKTQGKYSLKVVYPRNEAPSINTRKLFSNWSGFDFLTFDVFNPQNDIVPFVVRIDDQSHKRINLEKPLLPGENTVKISLSELSEKIDISKIGFVVLFLDSPKKRLTLYFDDMNLSKGGDVQKRFTKKFEHPRLFFTKDDLPQLREKFNNSQLWLKRSLLDYAESENDFYVWAFLYQMLPDDRCAQKAIDSMLKQIEKNKAGLEELALAFDWCYDKMNIETKERIISKIEQMALSNMKKKEVFQKFS